MIIGLADDWWSEGGSGVDPTKPWDGEPTYVAPAKTTPAAKKAAPRVGITKALDTIAPRTLSPTGAVRVWGLPPAVAYTLMAIAITGVGLLGYRAIAGGGRRVARNPRRGARSRKSRRKR